MRPTVIGIDARELLGARTGVGRYIGELLTRWMVRNDARRRHFILYTPRPLDITFPDPTIDVRVLPGTSGTWWEQTTMSAALRRDRPDVFFAPAYTAPLGLPSPLAVTIHDVSFSRHPEWFRRREGLRRRWLTRHAARRAAVVLTVSQFSAREIQDLYGIPPERIAVIPNGITRRGAGADSRREPLVLFVGSIFNRRNVPDLIAAFAKLRRSRPAARLIIVGDDRSWPPQPLAEIAGAAGVAEAVDFRRYVSDAELDALYARASVFAFLSTYEGFGLTPLEALSAGVPIVVFDTPAAREIYGDAAAFVPAHDVHAIAEAFGRLMDDAEARKAQLAAAGPVLARYSWDVAADRTLDHLERIARR